LQEYLLVAQDKVRVERYVRQGEEWVLTELSAPDDVLQIDAVNCSVKLSDVYSRIELPSGSPVMADDSETTGDTGATG
jgi:hypothetical protein